jgi:hypothetical protein
VSALLGHGYMRKAITERYIHSNPEALRPAADAIAEAIATNLGPSGTGRLLTFRA